MIRRHTLKLLYMETAQKVNLKALEKLCALFDCEVHKIFEYVPGTGRLNGKATEHFNTLGLSV